jgi:hypothetical protein
MKEMQLERVSSEELISMFEEAFEEQVAKLNNIEAFGVECNDRGLGKAVQINVDISGHAGTPTVDQFKKGDVEGSESVTICRDDIGEKTFQLVKSLTTYVSGNDYLVVYEAAV